MIFLIKRYDFDPTELRGNEELETIIGYVESEEEVIAYIEQQKKIETRKHWGKKYPHFRFSPLPKLISEKE